jgi:hypothetical protein
MGKISDDVFALDFHTITSFQVALFDLAFCVIDNFVTGVCISTFSVRSVVFDMFWNVSLYFAY